MQTKKGGFCFSSESNRPKIIFWCLGDTARFLQPLQTKLSPVRELNHSRSWLGAFRPFAAPTILWVEGYDLLYPWEVQ
jgi:hypothetical protein